MESPEVNIHFQGTTKSNPGYFHRVPGISHIITNWKKIEIASVRVDSPKLTRCQGKMYSCMAIQLLKLCSPVQFYHSLFAGFDGLM